MSKKITLKFLSDPGHGWLSVTHELIRKLGVADKISGYSYMTNTRAYLEEDRDAGIVLEALKAAGYEIKITESHTNKASNVRSMSSYMADFIINPLVYGEKINLSDFAGTWIYLGLAPDNKYVRLQNELGVACRIPWKKMFKYIECRVKNQQVLT